MAISVDVGQMLVNLSQSHDAVFKMLTGGAYVLGFAFAVLAIFSLKHLSESRTMMSGQQSLGPPLMYFLVAAVFLYMPSAIDSLMMTTFGATASPIGYSETSGDVVSADVTRAIYLMVQMVGLVAFIKGWLILAQSAKGGGSQQLGKALTHILGGILAINIIGTKNVIWASFGLSG